MARRHGAKRNLPGGAFPTGYGREAHLRGGDFDADGAVKKGKKDSLEEAGGRTGRVRELDRRGSKEKQELTPDQELVAMWRTVDNAAHMGGYNISSLKDRIKAELQRRYEEDGLRSADFGIKEALELIKNPPEQPVTEESVFGHEPSDEARDRFWQRLKELNDAGDYEILGRKGGLEQIAREVERKIEGEKIALEQFRGFYERVVGDPEENPEVVKEGAKLLAKWLSEGNDVNDITTELLSGMAMNAEAEVQYREYEEGLDKVEIDPKFKITTIENLTPINLWADLRGIEERDDDFIRELARDIEVIHASPEAVSLLNDHIVEIRSFLEKYKDELDEDVPRLDGEDEVDSFLRSYLRAAFGQFNVETPGIRLSDLSLILKGSFSDYARQILAVFFGNRGLLRNEIKEELDRIYNSFDARLDQDFKDR